MQIIKILVQIALLFVFSLFGDWLHSTLHIPVSGGILGMFLLLAALLVKIIRLEWIETGARFLLAYLPLVFIPAIVGVMNYTHTFAGKGVMLIMITVVSTLLVLVTAGHTTQLLAKTQKRKETP